MKPDLRVVKQISVVLDQMMSQLNSPASVIQGIPRINEVSSHFEDLMRELLNKTPGLICDFRKTSEARLPRSAYPDLELIDQESHRVYYLDPKLYAIGSRDSSFRTFYFEPKIATNKVREDAVHFIIGFEHEKPAADRHWKFTRWDLVDLSHFQVKLKAEFQGSNRDMYRPEAIVATSARAVERWPSPQSVALPRRAERKLVGPDSVEPKAKRRFPRWVWRARFPNTSNG